MGIGWDKAVEDTSESAGKSTAEGFACTLAVTASGTRGREKHHSDSGFLAWPRLA